ncbi:GNAT family N-acetyltransferase [Pokkaliibacter sp. MBI-7]|uniref:GNAT family N-acetyltransferase n=1 Tax=Pokkaliibacter sp. MBI-7 TaxID=3040600 RepID=UPI00244B2DA5|nr:GNAT family N-acetyltransferase [Pokkaliibacter sp. MBI-7]MDH2433350.1 GNAT family N-acetyltransferase [Pokkaliibacter sp. MBI-7]
MQIQRLGPQWAEAYRSLMLHAYGAHPDAFTSTVAERSRLPLSWWQLRLDDRADAQEQVWGAVEGSELLGVAGVSFNPRQKVAHKAHLFGMYVHPQRRQQGAGKLLVEAILAAARQHPGVLLVQLTVTEGNHAAEKLYQRCGFKAFGVEPFAVSNGNGFVSKVHMWCEVG